VHFSLVDLVLIAGAAFLVIHAARGSVVPYLTELIAFGLGLAAAFASFDALGHFIHARLGISLGVAGFGSFLLVLVLAHAVVQAPAHRAAGWLGEQLRYSSPGVRAIFGAVPALGIVAMLATILLSVMVALPVAGLKPEVSNSVLGSRIIDSAGFMRSPVQRLLVPEGTDSKRILESDPVSNPGEDAFYKLTFPPDLATQPDPVAEDRMLQRINNARAQVGLSALRADTLLQQAARAHSADMYQRHYFSHKTPDDKTPYDRLHDLRFHYVTAGENIAFAPDVDQAWDSLMKSPDHRANILNPDFRCVGIGAYRGLNGYEEMFTQDFADCSS
jgi:uncharacterized protein YkwD